MPGWAGELTCAQFLTTQAVKGGGEAGPLVRNIADAKDEACATAAAAALAPAGLLIDMRSKRGFALVKEIMENEAIGKLIWGADGDLTSLRYPVKTMGGGSAEGIEAKNVVDVQLGYCTVQRRLGMARMLTRLPEAATKGLPAKAAAVDFDTVGCERRRWGLCARPALASFRSAHPAASPHTNTHTCTRVHIQPHSQNKRAMQYPMRKDLCMYAVGECTSCFRALIRSGLE